MAERIYTVQEIMRMRAAVQAIGARSSIPMNGEVIEAQLRTYMANGTGPDELDQVAGDQEAAEAAQVEAAKLARA